MVAAAVVSAVFYGISVPLSKMLMDDVSSSLMSALLYLGAGAGMAPLVAARVLAAKRAARDAAPGVASNGAAPGSTTGSATSGNASGAAHEAPAGTAPRAHAPAADTSLTRKEIPLLIVMVAVNAASALLMMYGISNASAANASLLGNFEMDYDEGEVRFRTSLMAEGSLTHEVLDRYIQMPAAMLDRYAPGLAAIVADGEIAGEALRRVQDAR